MHSNFWQRAARLGASISLTALLAACAVTPTPFTQAEFETKATQDRTAMFAGQAELTAALTFPEALARVLKYNLDRRARMMEETLALGQLKLDRYDLLPKLTANAGYAGRSEPNATRSRGLYSQTTSTSEPTYSTDRDSITADLGLTWNVLDFGVSYYTANQNADRALIATERRRRTVANIVQEVRYAFWRAAAAQVLSERVKTAITTAEESLADVAKVENERLRNPGDSLRTQKVLLETVRQLEAIEGELNSAKAELAALINLPPGSAFTLEVPAEIAVPSWTLPLDKMEMLALANNPDLREQDYLSRIAVDDTRKEILKLLPGITFSFSRQYDNNSFLIDNRWNEAGAKLSWNLINLLSGPDRIEHAESAETVAETRRLALRMAVMAQVHVATNQFASASKQFLRADRLWTVERRLADLSGQQSRGGTQSDVERVSNETSAIAAELRRYQTYAQMQLAYGKLEATLGVDALPDRVASLELADLAAAIDERMTQLRQIDEPADETPAPAPAGQPAATPVAEAKEGSFFDDWGSTLAALVGPAAQ
jgi:outer membrane protein TolC